jgi:hypothetical protein
MFGDDHSLSSGPAGRDRGLVTARPQVAPPRVEMIRRAGVRLNRLISLTAVAVIASASALTPDAVAAGTMTGSGSTLVAPLEVEWAQAFQTFDGVAVNSAPVGCCSPR